MLIIGATTAPTDGIRHSERGTACYVGDNCLGNGTLFIAEGSLVWVNEENLQGFSLDYPRIAVHAISRDTSAFAHECLYMMLDGDFSVPQSESRSAEQRQTDEMNGDSGDEDEDSDEVPSTEMRFVPNDSSALGPMYTAMCDCQALHGDPNEDDSSGDEAIPVPFGIFGADHESVGPGGDGAVGMDADDGEAEEDGQFDDADGDEH